MNKVNIVSTMQQRVAVYKKIRNFFCKKQVGEVDTSILSKYATTDFHIDSFKTTWGKNDLYLQTSPELIMKRLLSMGIGDCYQICKVFRNESVSKNHSPEFSMLEWYRIDFSIFDLIDEVSELVKNLCPSLTALPIEIISYDQAFSKFEINPHKDDLKTIKSKVKKYCEFVPDLLDDKDEWLDFFLVTNIEKELGDNKLTFLIYYPSSMAALAKKTIDENGNEVSERFELYFNGIELANGFCELTDAKEQQNRFEKDNEKRLRLGKKTMPIDKDFIDALELGMPDCSGVALGIDRLLMINLGQKNINNLII